MKKVLIHSVFVAVVVLFSACSSKKTVSDDVSMGGSAGGTDVAMADLGSSSSGRAR